MNFSYLFKYIVIGDQSVGKSCIVMQFIDHSFKQQSDATIGVQFASKTIPINNELIKLQIWDTVDIVQIEAGQQAFKSITRSYYRATIGAIMVYDITSRRSFQSIAKWLEQTRNYSTSEHVVTVLVGNKNDCQLDREVTWEEGSEYAAANGLLFFESSAKQNKNITLIFQKLTEEVLARIQKGLIDMSDQNGGVRLGDYKRPDKDQNEKKCC